MRGGLLPTRDSRVIPLVPLPRMGHDLALQVMLTADQIRDRVGELAEEISASYPSSRQPHLVSVLKGGFIFSADLIRALQRPVTIDFIEIGSYGTGTSSSGVVRLTKDLDTDIEGRDVLIVEDVVDTGQTLAWLLGTLRNRRPRSLRTVTLLEKTSRRIAWVEVEHVGFSIEDLFVVGYGLDHAEQYRQLPHVAILSQPGAVEGTVDPKTWRRV